MQRNIPKRGKSVKFSPGTSEDGSEDEGARHRAKPKKSIRSLKPGPLSIQPGLSNAHLVLRRYTALDEFGAVDLSDDEQEVLNSPKVAPAQPIDRYSQELQTMDKSLHAFQPAMFPKAVFPFSLQHALWQHSRRKAFIMTGWQLIQTCIQSAGTLCRHWCHQQMPSWHFAVLVLTARRKAKGHSGTCCLHS